MSIQRDSNFYDSKYLAEYYDLWSESNQQALDIYGDREIYLQALQFHLADAKSRSETCAVMDIGTGTCRILINLVNDALSSSVQIGYVDLIGVDKEPAMLVRAKEVECETQILSRALTINWVLSEAATLTSTKLIHWSRFVDMLVFGMGSVSHLVGDEEPQRFFNEASKLLKPDSGVLYLPIRNDLISKRSDTEQPPSAVTRAQLDDVQEFPSKLYPDLVYKQFPIESSTVVGPIRTDKYRFEVVKRIANGKEELVEENAVTVHLRIWKKSELIDWAAAAGLTCIATDYTSHETYYMFQKLTT